VSYRLREHTADVAVEAGGADLGATFAAAAEGLAAACHEDPPAGGDRFDVSVRASSRESLLVDFLNELVYERDVRDVLPVDVEATVRREGGEWVVDASARGVPLDRVRAREVKAVTYSQLELEETPDGWAAYVVLDV
jgi:SHS2 domain-containing protein